MDNLPAVIGPPEPLIPAHINLQAYDWFPLKHKRLRRSEFWLHASDQVKALSIELWCVAYEQLPAGSLPNDDVALSEAVGFGRRDLTQWRAVKADVMAAWVLCSDGRWYHPTLCEVALETFNLREAKRHREAEKKRRQRGGKPRDEMSPGDNGDASAPPQPQAPQGKTAPAEGSPAPAQEECPPGNRPTIQDKTLQEDSRLPDKVEDVLPVVAPQKASPGTKGTRLGKFWTASQKNIDYAVSQGFSTEEVRRVEDDFFDFWTAKAGKDGVKLDWDATWRTWVRREADRRGRGNGGGQSGGGTGPGGRGTARGESLGRMQQGAMAALDRKR